MAKTTKQPTKDFKDYRKGWEARMAQGSPSVALVTWMDACADSGVVLETGPAWQSEYTTRGAVIQTLGFLLEHNKDWVIVGQEMHAERGSGFRRLTHIPTPSVCRLEILKKT